MKRGSRFGRLALGGLLLCSRSALGTNIAGGSIVSDQTWTLAGSPYTVAGDLSIASGASLTLEPGVEVLFANHDALATGSDATRIELLVQGSLLAEGTVTAPIVLHAKDGDFANSWYGVIVDAAATSVSLRHVEISAAKSALESSAPGAVLKLSSSLLRHNLAGILLTDGAPAFDSLFVSENSVYGIYAEANAHSVSFTLTNSVLSLNGSYGVYATAALGKSVSAAATNCTLYGNTSSGVTARAYAADAQATVTLKNCVIARNGIVGVDSSVFDGGVSSVTTTYCDLYSNGTDFIGSSAGAGCIALDPAFIGAPTDLRLGAESPCIDSGTDVGAPPLDLLGRARPQAEAADMGAYEYTLGDEPVSGSAGGDAGAGGTTDVGGWGGAADVSTPSGAGGNPASEPAMGGRADGSAQGGALGGDSSATPNGANRDDAGCSCRVAANPEQPARALGLAVALLLLARRRRAGRARLATTRAAL